MCIGADLMRPSDRPPATNHPPAPAPAPAFFYVKAARRMEAPPFDLPALLGKEFGDREGWKDVLREAQRLALELDAILVRSERTTTCTAKSLHCSIGQIACSLSF